MESKDALQLREYCRGDVNLGWLMEFIKREKWIRKGLNRSETNLLVNKLKEVREGYRNAVINHIKVNMNAGQQIQTVQETKPRKDDNPLQSNW